MDSQTRIAREFLNIEERPTLEESKAELRRIYNRKLAKVHLCPCAHIIGTPRSGKEGSGSGFSGLYEHHAVLDTVANEVIHYSRRHDDANNQIMVESIAAFEESYYPWRIAQLPSSVEKAKEVLERARSKIGEEQYSLVMNNCEHFASWCFEGSGSSKQVWSAGANVATSAKGGVVAGIAAASATTTVTTPWYFLGIIPWGTTTATVPMMGTAAAVGVGAAAFVGWVGVGVGMGYGMNKWVESSNVAVSNYIPIGIFNCSSKEVTLQLKNIESSSAFYSSSLDDVVHDARAYCGIGQRKIVLGPGIGGELNPPAEDELFGRFSLAAFEKDASTEDSSWPTFIQVATCEVKRGDVIIYRDGRLMQMSEEVTEA
eukprot:TRINITY_DN81955_c0_g1_i1.p1 TRINITY_DN81955_c0_g1~~TRINITY_DN81955_c0_g1_i1.p1  ORF type:complete len:381 (+),score=47.80 TRINITY_DN81955_c0_g1_i1:30-1145(+)